MAARDRQPRIGSSSTIKAPSLNAVPRSLRNLLQFPDYNPIAAVLLLLVEVVLNAVIIHFVPYTEIDWKTYMQQVKGYLSGERLYTKLEGDTGPLVYPAGFLRIYGILYEWTDSGRDVRRAQYIFAGLYLFTLALVFGIYHRARRIPPYALALLVRSKRLHSIYVLRLFNDGVAMLFLYASVFCVSNDLLSSATVLLSCALSIKMNILLFAPAYGLLILQRFGLAALLSHSFLAFALQIIIGAPFLSANPSAYLSRAFELGRAFLYNWTVNWRFISEETFLSKSFALVLLTGHIVTLFVFAETRWCKADGGLIKLVTKSLRSPRRAVSVRATSISVDDAVSMLFTCNFIGMLFARSLHYQFYAWYAHQLVYLVWRTPYPITMRVGLLFAIEYAFNIFPSTTHSSLVLLAAHITVLAGLYLGPVKPGQKRSQEEPRMETDDVQLQRKSDK